MSRRRANHDPHHPTAAPPPDDGREARALSSAENADLCAGCVTCCTYLSIEIDTPRAAWEYDQWIWALHHRGIQIYLERPEKWFLHIEAVCEQLDGQGRCRIHGRHPVLCREYDPRSCERRYPLSDVRAWFRAADELEAWLARERPGHFARLMAYRRDQPQGPARADARADRAARGPGFVPVEALARAAAGVSPPAARPSAASTRRGSAARRAE